MAEDARAAILARRTRFIAAATMIGVAVVDNACSAEACLSIAPNCDTDPVSRNAVEGPTKMCVGDRADLAYVLLYCGRSDSTASARFTSSDASVIAIDPSSRTARAVGPGRATITGNYSDGSGERATLTIEVSACGDATSDARDDG